MGWADVDLKTVEEALSFIEGKEMARDAMNSSDNIAPISTYKTRAKAACMPPPPTPPKARCGSCNVEMDKFVWNSRMKQMIEPSLCKPCWTRENSSQKAKKTPKKKDHRDRTDRTPDDETSALLIGSITELPVDAQADPSDDEAEHSVAEQESQIPATEFVEEVAEPDSEIQCRFLLLNS